MTPPRRAGAIGRFGLAGAPDAPAAVSELAAARDSETETERDREPASSQSRETESPQSREPSGQRDRDADPEPWVGLTVRFRQSESFAADAFALSLGQRRGRRVDKASVTRALWRLAAADAALQARLLDALDEDQGQG